MRLRIAAALSLAAGLVATPGFAQNTPPDAGTPAPTAEQPPMTPSPTQPTAPHKMRAHRGAMRSMAKGDSGNAAVDQLNNMSLQAAKQGQTFTPPGAQK
jgi:hypothetical protein